MSRISKLIDDTTYNNARKELKSHGNTAKITIKLKAIIAAKTHGITRVAEIFDITRRSLMSWIKTFKKHGCDKLTVQAGRGRKPKISNDQLVTIKGWVSNNPNITIKELRIMIKGHFKIDVSIATTNRVLKKLSFSYITPRPKHNKQELLKQDEFKKKSSGNG